MKIPLHFEADKNKQFYIVNSILILRRFLNAGNRNYFNSELFFFHDVSYIFLVQNFDIPAALHKAV